MERIVARVKQPLSGRCKRSFLQFAALRRLGEKSAGRLQDFIGSAQLLVLAFQCLEALAFLRSDAFACAAVDLVAFDHEPKRKPCRSRRGQARLHFVEPEAPQTCGSEPDGGEFQKIFVAQSLSR